MNIVVGKYTGDTVGDSSKSITGIGFLPDAVFIVSDLDTEGGVFRLSSQGAGDIAFLVGDAGGETANLIESLDADGFTVGGDSKVNGNGESYYYTCIKDDSTDFLVGSYTGDGGSGQREIDTDCGFTPAMAMVSGENTNGIPYLRTESMPGTDSSKLSTSTYESNKVETLIADGFGVNKAQAHTNTSGVVYHYMIMKKVSGATDFNTYTGNSTDDRSITGAGFQPNNVWLFNDDGRPEHYATSEVSDLTMTWDDQDAGKADIIKSLDSDGFTISDDNDVNASGKIYDWVCLKAGSTSGSTILPIMFHHYNKNIGT